MPTGPTTEDMVRDEILLRVKTAYSENDYALVDKILSEGSQDWTAEEEFCGLDLCT